MKNLILGLFAVFAALSVTAQYDPKALEILEAMSKKYKSIPAFEANITCNLSNDVDKVNDEFKGKITVKGDKFRMVCRWKSQLSFSRGNRCEASRGSTADGGKLHQSRRFLVPNRDPDYGCNWTLVCSMRVL